MVTPLKKFLAKHPTPSGMSSRQWAALSAAMREEKFFSARVENVRLLERLQGMIRDFLTGEREVLENGESVMKVGSCADFVKQAMDWLEAEGLREADGEGEEYHRDVSHVGAEARLRLIFRTNVRQAVGAAQWESAMMPANLKAWPAFRFVRFPGAKVKRPVHVANEDEVRLKTDFEFWADEMNAADLGGFEVPWPPFGFNSYMDQIPVSRKECEAMGFLKPGEPLKRPRGAERFGIDLVERYGYGKKASTAKLPDELKAKLKKYYEDRWGVKQDGADKVVFPAKQVADMAKKEAEQLELASKVGDKINVPEYGIGDKVRNAVKKATQSVDFVHTDGPLPQAHINQIRDRQTLGAFNPWTKYASIDISNVGKQTDFVVCHEIGHYVDLWGLGKGQCKFKRGMTHSEIEAEKRSNYGSEHSPEMEELMSAIMGSPTLSLIRARCGRYYRYLERRRECFARAYAQFIAVESHDKILIKQLNFQRQERNLTQWTIKEFKPIRNAFRNLFKKKGWMK